VRPARWRTRARVQRDRGDAGQPGSRPSAKPAVYRGPSPIGHHIQQPTTLQIHQASDVSGGRDPSGLEEAGLVQPERGHILQPRRVAHQRPAMILHRPHHRRPPNPQVARYRRHRMGILTDPPARLSAGPLGQHRPRADGGRLFGPGQHPADRLTTAPEALAPQQHHRAATDRQVTHPHHASAMRGG
jgi:hypothetical protein